MRAIWPNRVNPNNGLDSKPMFQRAERVTPCKVPAMLMRLLGNCLIRDRVGQNAV